MSFVENRLRIVVNFDEEADPQMEADEYLTDHSQCDWQHMLGDWEWLLEDDFEVAPWLVSKFGDLFFLDEEGVVYWLNISDGELTEVAENETEFIELLEAENYIDELFQISFVHEMSDAGKKLAAGECYGFRTLPVLGGEYDASNIDVWPIADYWKFCGRIHVQLDGLPDGTELDIDVPER